MKSVRRPGLDLLRAVAIGLVLIAHMPMSRTGEPAILGPMKFHCGELGVDLFFALSGFLIGGILLDTDDRLASVRVLGGFWLSRWLRTLPNYYLLIPVNIAMRLWVYPQHHVRWAQVPPVAVFCQNLFSEPGGFFAESWSLSIEEWFYVLLPLGLFLGLKAGWRFRRVMAVLLAVMFLEPILRRLSLPVTGPYGYVTFPVVNRFDALACGVAAAWLARLRPEAWLRCARPLFVIGMILASGFWTVGLWSGFEQSRWLRVLLPLAQPFACTLLLPAMEKWQGFDQRWLSHSAAAMARWSYSLYLTNLFAAMLLRLWLPQLAETLSGVLIGDTLFVVLSVVIAATLFHFWEHPFLRLRENISLCRVASGARHHRSSPAALAIR